MVSERDPDGLVVSRRHHDGTTREIEIVLTREEWDDIVEITFGDIGSAVEYVRGMVEKQPPGQRYLVHGMYDLVPSSTAESPEERDLAEVQALLRQYPDGIPGGRWVANPPEG